MKDLEKIAVLIDADNTQLSKLGLVMLEVSSYGRIVVKRAYGNWEKPSLKNWKSELNELAIKAEQQFDYATGKNATDIAMVISALDLLHLGIYDGFVLVASDSDYTPLAIRLRESGEYVIGVGEKKTPIAFRNACDEFILLENLSHKEASAKPSKPSKKVVSAVKHEEAADQPPAAQEPLPDADESPESEKVQIEDIPPNIEEIHSLLKIASEKYQNDNEFTNVSSAGLYIKRAKPDFDARSYGYAKLPDLLRAFPKKYEVHKYQGKGTVKIIAYKCL